MTHKIFKSYIENSKKVFASLTKEELQSLNEKEWKRAEDSHRRFKEGFENGTCYLCGGAIKVFSIEKPCLHWLLRPKGLKNKHFKSLYPKVGYFQMEAYARWVANLASPLTNINDLAVERREKKIFETTIKYKQFEWSFSCSPSDLEGHQNANEGKYPHFHFQMRIDKKPFIKYKQNHIAFTDEDLWKLSMLNQNEIPIRMNPMFGGGMGTILCEENIEHVFEITERAENEEEATFKFETLVSAKPGETISGDEISNLIKESQKTGVPLAKLLQGLDADVETIVTPGNGVPEIAGRSVTKRNN